MHLGLIAIVVSEYDPAISFFVAALGFELVEDSPALPGCAHPGMREHLRIGWSKASADVTQGEPHVSSRGEAINAC